LNDLFVEDCIINENYYNFLSGLNFFFLNKILK